jgi:hypothetical protein
LIVRIAERDQPFVQIDKRTLSDQRLSLEAKGLLAYLLSKPAGWKARIKDLVKQGRGNIRSVRRAMRELKTCGYALVMFARGPSGKFAGKEILIFERPDLSTEMYKNGTSAARKFRQMEVPASYPIRNTEFSSDNEGTSNKGLSANSQLPVQEEQPTTENRPAVAGLEEQLDRLERIAGLEKVAKYRGWWLRHAGKSHDHVKALRKALDDYVTNRKRVLRPYNWIVRTFKNKVRTLNAAADAD